MKCRCAGRSSLSPASAPAAPVAIRANRNIESRIRTPDVGTQDRQPTSATHLRQQRLGLFQVGGVEALGETGDTRKACVVGCSKKRTRHVRSPFGYCYIDHGETDRWTCDFEWQRRSCYRHLGPSEVTFGVRWSMELTSYGLNFILNVETVSELVVMRSAMSSNRSSMRCVRPCGPKSWPRRACSSNSDRN